MDGQSQTSIRMIFTVRRSVIKAVSFAFPAAFRQLSGASSQAVKRKRVVAPFAVVPEAEPSDLTLVIAAGAAIVALAFTTNYCFKLAKLISIEDYDFEAWKKRTPVDDA